MRYRKLDVIGPKLLPSALQFISSDDDVHNEVPIRVNMNLSGSHQPRMGSPARAEHVIVGILIPEHG